VSAHQRAALALYEARPIAANAASLPALRASPTRRQTNIEVNYMWPKPGPDMTAVPKVSFVTKVGDLGCGIGYYKIGRCNIGRRN
jgi:hypothetical protein